VQAQTFFFAIDQWVMGYEEAAPVIEEIILG
jgi:hypothetical protein